MKIFRGKEDASQSGLSFFKRGHMGISSFECAGNGAIF